ncbi:hypothetical protein CPC08DRAFT_771698, partial [Agrocybe pediades]
MRQGASRKFFVNNVNPERRGRYVCEGCWARINNAPDTVAQQVSTQRVTPAPIQGTASEPTDPAAIRRDINEAWRTGSHRANMPRVAAMPPGGPVVPSPLHNQAVPWAIQSYNAQPVGYTAAHPLHAQATQSWSTQAYAPSHSNQLKQLQQVTGTGPLGIASGFNVDITVYLYQPDRYVDKSGNNIRVPGVKETITVPCMITTSQLMLTIRREMVEPIGNFLQDIPFDISSMVIRETTEKKWQMVKWPATAEADQVYFMGHTFMQTLISTPGSSSARKISVAAPKKPKKPLEFGLVLPPAVWDMYEAREEAKIMGAFSISGAVDKALGVHATSGRKRKSNEHIPVAATSSSSESSSNSLYASYSAKAPTPKRTKH